MAGRYGFAMPSPQERDGWFRVGQIDVTTTVLVTGLGVLSMFLFAISKTIAYDGVFVPELVREGEVWRLITWPLVNPPLSIFEVIGLLFFWYFGRYVEDDMGRVPYTALLVAMAVIPALVVTGINLANQSANVENVQWYVAVFSVDLFGVALLTIFVLNNPGARFFFNIPGWVIVAAVIGVRVLSAIGNRGWGTLTMLLVLLAVGLFGARQRGMLDEFTFIPRLRSLAGSPSPYGNPPKASRRRKRSSGRSKGGSGAVVAGPWQGSAAAPTNRSGGLSPLEQAELDTLLDIISEQGIDAMTATERSRLRELSERLRGS